MPANQLRIVVKEALADVADAAAIHVRAAAAEAIAARGRFRIALAGGSTPRALYPRLVEGVDWTRATVFFGDERAVGPTDPQSNYRMAQETLLGPAAVPADNVHRWRAEDPDLDAAARDYERLLPPAFDVLLLGIGPDGHTASLFPGAPTLDERTRRVVPSDSPFPPPRRLTITPPVIAAARRTAVIVAAREKAGIVQRALEGPRDPHQLPVQLALSDVWILDRAAASKLTPAPA